MWYTCTLYRIYGFWIPYQVGCSPKPTTVPAGSCQARVVMYGSLLKKTTLASLIGKTMRTTHSIFGYSRFSCQLEFIHCWLYFVIYTWIFHPCRFLDPGLRAWNFSTKNPFQHLTQILDPGNFGWFVILTLGGGFMYIPQIENNPVPIAPALRCHMDQTTSRGGRISVPQIINIYNI